MPTFKVTTRKPISRARLIPAGSYVTITIPGSQTRPNPDEICRAFEEKYGVDGVGASQLSAITFDKIG